MKFSRVKFGSLLAVALIAACGGGVGPAGDRSGTTTANLLATSVSSPAEYGTVVQQLYIAYFGRPADSAGLANFEAGLSAAGAPTTIDGLTAAYSTNATVKGLIDGFGNSAESSALYTGGTSDFVTAIYRNVLGRSPQASGLSFWVNSIDSGTLTKGNAALSIMAGALSNTTTQGLADAALVRNKVTVAGNFTTGASASAYRGATAATSARAMLSGVTSTTDTSVFQSTVTFAIAALTPSNAPGLSLLAGTIGGWGDLDGTGGAARFNSPGGPAVDAAGNIYVADANNYTIRKITPAGIVTTLAGKAGYSGHTNGTGTAARLWNPKGVAVDAAGNVFLADSNKIRKITPAGVVTTLAGGGYGSSADGTGTAAVFQIPQSPAIDGSGNIYVADSIDNTVRKITSAGVVTTLAGTAGVQGSADGSGASASFSFPNGVAVDTAGNVYVADTGNNTIRKITPAGIVTTLAGAAGTYGFSDGTGAAARFSSPRDVAVDGTGNIYVADTGHQIVRKITPAGVVTTLAGVNGVVGAIDGTATTATFYLPEGLVVDGTGNIYVTDTGNNTIRKITSAGVVTTLAGAAEVDGTTDSIGPAAGFNYPEGATIDTAGNVYVADRFNHTIRKISPAGVVTTVAGNAEYVGSADGTGSAARFFYPRAVAADGAGNLYVADTGNNTIRKITSAGVVTTLAGTAGVEGAVDGVGPSASFYVPNGIAVDASGNVYVSDQGNKLIRKISPAGVVTTIAGQEKSNEFPVDGTGAAARFFGPGGIAVDGAGMIYVSDMVTVRKITPAGVVTTLAGSNWGFADGTGTAARFYGLRGITVDETGNVFVVEEYNHTVRKITPGGVVTTVAGSEAAAGIFLGELPGRLGSPVGLAINATGVLYLTSGNAILKLQL